MLLTHISLHWPDCPLGTCLPTLAQEKAHKVEAIKDEMGIQALTPNIAVRQKWVAKWTETEKISDNFSQSGKCKQLRQCLVDQGTGVRLWLPEPVGTRYHSHSQPGIAVVRTARENSSLGLGLGFRPDDVPP